MSLSNRVGEEFFSDGTTDIVISKEGTTLTLLEVFRELRRFKFRKNQ